MRMLLLSLVLAGCATGGNGWAESEQAALDRDLAGRAAGEPRSCIPIRSGQNLRPVAGRLFVRRDGDTIWVNRPIHECLGFRPLSTVIVEVHGSQYCRGDHVRALGPGTTIPGPICVLGDWVPYRRPGA